MLHEAISKLEGRVAIRKRYDNFIGGEWTPPVAGEYFDNICPIDGHPICQVARGRAADIELALDAAHKARDAWGKTSVAERASILNKIADRLEANLNALALVETIDNGKPIREPLSTDLPLAVDHFRYFAACIRAQEGSNQRNRSRHRRLSFPRTARRRRPDHPVELPDPDGGVENRAGARRRQLHRAETGRTDADEHSGGRRSHRAISCRRASSISSTASASKPASRWRRTSGSPRSPSPARRRPAGSSCNMRRKI